MRPQWKSLSKEEQAQYYVVADREKVIHNLMFPDWSARDNYVRTPCSRTVQLMYDVHSATLHDPTHSHCKEVSFIFIRGHQTESLMLFFVYRAKRERGPGRLPPGAEGESIFLCIFMGNNYMTHSI